MVEISPALASYDVVEPVALKQLSKVQLVDQNKGSKSTGEALKKVIDNFYFTDVISRRQDILPYSTRNDANKMIARQQWLDVRRQRRLEILRQITWRPGTLLRILEAGLPMDRDL
jgi:NADH dehydrogenase (ubiquinone) Fe-S protein 1